MRRLAIILLLIAIAAAAPACGGGGDDDGGQSTSVPEGAVAVVGDREISQDQLEHQISLKVQSLKVQGTKEKDIPKEGSQAYRTQIVQPLVDSLVFAAQLENIAEQLGVEVTDEQVQSKLDEQIKQFYGGDRAKYEKDLKKFGVSDADVRQQIRLSLLQQRVQATILKEADVTDGDVEKYYNENKATYATPDSREVNFVLTGSGADAQKARSRLQGGESFNDVAKDLAIAPGPPSTGGKLTAQKGSLEPNFEKAAFSLDDGELSGLVRVSDDYMKSNLPGKCKPTCFFLIEPTGPVVKGKQQTLDEVAEQIRQTLQQTTQQTHLQERVQALLDQQKKQTRYASGFQPPKQPAVPSAGGSTGGSTTP